MEKDPLFSECAYRGDGDRGIILKIKVSKGDIYFYRAIKNYPCIIAFYEVDKVLDIPKAKMDNTIMMNYQNPYLF